MRRQSIAFVLVDAAFLADSKFRALARRLADADDFNSAVGAWLIALADARRNGSPTIDVAGVTGSRFGADLLAVGLTTDQGFPPGPFTAWSPKSPQQASAGKARAAQADAKGLRDGRGWFMPAESSEPSALDALDSVDQRGPAFPSPLLNSTPGEMIAREKSEPKGVVLTWLARHGCDIRPGNGYHRKLITAVEVHGSDALIETMDQLAAAGTAPGDVKGYLFGAIDALDAARRPRRGDVSRAVSQSDAAKTNTRRAEETRRRNAEMSSIPASAKSFAELVPPSALEAKP